MGHVNLLIDRNCGTIQLQRGKVNALNESFLDEIRETFEKLHDDDAIRTVVLTGSGSFFSFGFDIPELYAYTQEDFARFLNKFTGLYKYIFLYPKPVIAAINGHAIAGGCMLATACDQRIMAEGKFKISLNEITFGASVFQGSVELLRYWVGGRAAQEILFGGAMYSGPEALRMGLVDEIIPGEEWVTRTAQMAEKYASLNPAAFAHMKRMLRRPVVDRMEKGESESIRDFLKIWYSDDLRSNLREIKIRD